MSVYCGTPTRLRVTTPKGRILLRGESDSSTVMTVLTSPTRKSPEQKQLFYCENDWETLGDSYGLEVDTERRNEDGMDINNGRCFRESIRVQDSEKTLVGGEWGDQFHVAYIDGVRPVLIQIKCKDDDNLAEDSSQQYLTESPRNGEFCNDEDQTKFDNKDVYLMYYIEQDTTE